MLLVHEIKLPLQAMPEEAFTKARAVLRLKPADIAAQQVYKISVDARKGQPLFVYSIAVTLANPAKEAGYSNKGPGVQWVQQQPFLLTPGKEALTGPVMVCGYGPAGLFAALELAQAGYKPIVLERGPALEQRKEAIQRFEQGGELDENANVQFGEGGAGTYSDGKLTTRIKDPLCGRVTEYLLKAGAPEEIAFKNKPHIGTDLLQNVLKNLRERLLAMGGQVLFNTQLNGLLLKNGQLYGVQTNQGEMPCGVLVLAVGHSARDTFAMLHNKQVEMEAKPFSVGFRAEHLQKTIEEGLYHTAAGHPALPPAEYALSAQIKGRGVYTFCMCPGGHVVGAQSEKNTVVTNGMSYHARNGMNANAALVAGVGPADFGHGPLDGVLFQQRLEQAAFTAGGSNYTAPAQSLESFMENTAKLPRGEVQPTYPRGVQGANLGALLPQEVTEAIRGSIPVFGRRLPGYGRPDTLFTGLETRTSSPVRIPRGEGLESLNTPGVWPCGEGAGYAGGIMSAAVDGVRVAKAIIERYAPPD